VILRAPDAPPDVGSMDVEGIVRDGLGKAADGLRQAGVPVPHLGGKLLRPLVAYALVEPELRGQLDERFWCGALAVQMVHEASLLHDDILDGATVRRGVSTVAASRGVGQALVLGDHYLTGAYRAAAATGSQRFLDCFIVAVERTVAGEIAQGRAIGTRLSSGRYEEIVAGKSGELFGAAAALGGAVLGLGAHEERVAFGRALGTLYQRVDDLLDFCPTAATGKPQLQDYRQRKWTWVLDLAGLVDFSPSEADVMAMLFLGREGAPSAARRAVEAVRAERDALLERHAALAPNDKSISGILDAWVRAAAEGVSAQERTCEVPPARRDAGRDVVASAHAVGGPTSWKTLFGRHARTFRFAARLFPPDKAALVRGLYAYCRFTDDLVDEGDPGVSAHERAERLDAWRFLTREAFEGRSTGVSLLDDVLGEAAQRGVSWRYPDALLAGVAMDLAPAPYPDWERLEEYTFGVAGAVGGWITQLLGLADDDLLECAHALGHAMQLTNILRDVGEDLDRGRVYLPLSLLEAHGLDADDLRAFRAGGDPMPQPYRRVLDLLMARADGWYARAWPGIRLLPPWFRRPVAVAAQAYRGIHREVRRNGYDNLRLRAHTSLAAKIVLAAGGLVRART
jgi:phytoene synthase